jgi:hypothetical protein
MKVEGFSMKTQQYSSMSLQIEIKITSQASSATQSVTEKLSKSSILAATTRQMLKLVSQLSAQTKFKN